MSNRLFVAIALDDDARARCAEAARRLREAGWAGRWVPPANYHVTTAFLGAVDDVRVADVCAATRAAAARHAPFALQLDALGGFPSGERPRVAWFGPAAGDAAFRSLCGTIRDGISALGFTFDADAVAHVTLARSTGDVPLPPIVVSPVVLAVDALVVYRSRHDPPPTRHEPITRIPLRGS